MIAAITKISDEQLKKLKDAIPDQADEHEYQEKYLNIRCDYYYKCDHYYTYYLSVYPVLDTKWVMF